MGNGWTSWDLSWNDTRYPYLQARATGVSRILLWHSVSGGKIWPDWRGGKEDCPPSQRLCTCSHSGALLCNFFFKLQCSYGNWTLGIAVFAWPLVGFHCRDSCVGVCVCYTTKMWTVCRVQRMPSSSLPVRQMIFQNLETSFAEPLPNRAAP